jgi:hypothetical protein
MNPLCEAHNEQGKALFLLPTPDSLSSRQLTLNGSMSVPARSTHVGWVERKRYLTNKP